MPKYDNRERLEGVSEMEWQEALDELTAYLKWRLRGRTKWGAHSEKVLEIPALDYYTEEAAAKLIEGHWRWQERYTLGQQLVEIASNLITKQTQKYLREHPFLTEDGRCKRADVIPERKPEFIELREPERLPDVMDDDGAEELDETYEMVMRLVSDDEELTVYVEAIRACGHFDELPEYLGMARKKVYRLQEKLMRRVRRSKMSEGRGKMDDTDEGKKRMRFIDKIYMFEAESSSAEESYNAFGTTREEHQKRMLAFIHQKLEANNIKVAEVGNRK